MTPSPTPPQSIWKLSARHSTSPRPPEPPNNLPGSPPPDPFPPEPMLTCAGFSKSWRTRTGTSRRLPKKPACNFMAGYPSPLHSTAKPTSSARRPPPTPHPHPPSPPPSPHLPSPPFGPPTPTDPPKHPRPRTRPWQSPCFPRTPPHDRY